MFNRGDEIIIYWDDGDHQFICETVFHSMSENWVNTKAGKFRKDRVKYIDLVEEP